VSYQDKPLMPSPGTPPTQLPSRPRYLAFLLFADGSSHLIDLGPSAPMDRAARNVHSALANRAVDLSSAEEFYTLAFRPLLPHLGGIQQLFLAPDGLLALVPFDALHDGSRLLLDVFDIVYIMSGKDLLPREGTSPADSVVVVADPDFNAPVVAAAEFASRSAVLEGFYASQRALSDILSFMPLAGTLHEAESVRRVYPQARLLLGKDATKASLLGLSAPGILHIATHGFFVEEAPAPAGARTVGVMGGLSSSSSLLPPDPLLRSGLVLAGARVKAAQQSLQDSVVTGLEMAGMDLWGTQLVVLSACDTGRGTIMPGQGVYGLRRALVLAGAETLVTSLWKVRDDTTSELMSAYYRHLKAGQGRISALRSAMRELRERHAHPFFWAPFIGIGQDTPLRGVAAD
jgi:CHAT domain-containing protein